MSAQRLSDRTCRRLARFTGQDVLRGWSHGGYTLDFVTPDHQHGWYDKKTKTWGWDINGEVHYTSCYETWPEQRKQMNQRKHL